MTEEIAEHMYADRSVIAPRMFSHVHSLSLWDLNIMVQTNHEH